MGQIIAHKGLMVLGFDQGNDRGQGYVMIHFYLLFQQMLLHGYCVSGTFMDTGNTLKVMKNVQIYLQIFIFKYS